ncbi:diaminopimelate decarboxylase [Synechococcus sp. PCC 7336]|uniref:diaminopimelate decarboxylase n=1 Tax=Synechococcus sp. PCC 7336 TaxID=195250 RepID=UPI00034D9615|nr:diaminopimelate decarboxylase [Synechococcus sp. PCC 7336]
MVSTPALPVLPTIAASPNQSLYPITATINAAGHLEVGGCDVVELATQYGTPLYIVDETTIRQSCRSYRDSWSRHYSDEADKALVLYASKAWNCKAICALVAEEGLGLDVVSGGELYTALEAGVPGDRIYLHGNYKSAAELQLAIDAGATVVLDNLHELQMLTHLAQGQQQPVRVMVRVTPGIECHTHEYIRTGHLDSKFGFDPNALDDLFERLSQVPQLAFVGLHAHIGSQIFELQPHTDLGNAMVQFWLKARRYGLDPTELNVGGGLGIRYTEADDPPSIDEWVQAVSAGIKQSFDLAGLPLPKVLCEPGRSLVGSSTITAYTVGGSKEIPEIRTYLSVDGGMSDNPRPITYQAAYTSAIANRPNADPVQTVTVAGKHCESGDVLLKDVRLPAIAPGDILAVLATGAYNYSMASNYNRIPRPAALLVDGGRADTIIERETYSDLVRQDRLPIRLTARAR